MRGWNRLRYKKPFIINSAANVAGWLVSPLKYLQAWGFTVNSMPSDFMTASVVFSVGLPFSLKER